MKTRQNSTKIVSYKLDDGKNLIINMPLPTINQNFIAIT